MIKKCKCGFLEEIHGFISLGEFEKFKKYLEEQVQKNNLSEVDADLNYEKGLIYGGKWYKCLECNEIWRLVDPDFPFKGLWEKVEI
jgi:hypothetical protein